MRLETFLLACAAEVPRVAAVAGAVLLVLALLAVVDILTASVYRAQRAAAVAVVRDLFRWHLPDTRDRMPPSWRPRDASHLGRALRDSPSHPGGGK